MEGLAFQHVDLCGMVSVTRKWRQSLTLPRGTGQTYGFWREPHLPEKAKQWRDGQNVEWPQRGILFCHKQIKTVDSLAGWTSGDSKGSGMELHTLGFSLCEICRVDEWTGTGRKLVAACGRGRGGRGVMADESEFSLWGDKKCSKIRQRWWLSYFVNILKTTELYNLKGWILWYVNYISIKLL